MHVRARGDEGNVDGMVRHNQINKAARPDSSGNVPYCEAHVAALGSERWVLSFRDPTIRGIQSSPERHTETPGTSALILG